jgi:predicted peroxiredoxin
MANGGKVVINLSTGLEDPERVTVAFLVGDAAAASGREVVMFLTKDAVRLALPGHAVGIACEGCPPLERLFQQYIEHGGTFYACPICLNSRKLEEATLVPEATVAGATPLWEWIGEGAEVFSY